MLSKLLQKIKKQSVTQVTLPERFSFMPKEEQSQFINEVNSFFKHKYPNFLVDLPLGQITDPSSEGKHYGLDTVAQIYYQSPPRLKQKVIKDHFNKLYNVDLEEEKILSNLNDFNEVRKFLAVRLYPTDYEPSVYDFLVSQKDIEGIVTTLVFDLPSSITNVKPEQLKSWKYTKDELFNIGLKNTFLKLDKEKIKLAKYKLSEKNLLWQLTGNSLFTATNALRLENYPAMIGSHGSLVIIPHRTTIIAYLIEDLAVLEVINSLIFMASGMFNEGPGSITKNLYWYHNKEFLNIPYTLDISNNKISITPPEEFVEMLNSLDKR